MALFFWDASALAKRYFGEVGSDTVNAIFASVPLGDMATTPWGYTETYAILVRRLNSGLIDLPTFTTSVTSLQAEVVTNPDFSLYSISDTTIFASISTIQNHNLNATDSAILTMLLDLMKTPGT